MKITYLGQCAYIIEMGGVRVVSDPYLSDAIKGWQRAFPAPCTLKEANPDVVIISHNHIDHMDPITLGQYISEGGAAPIAAPAPECFRLEKFGVTNIIEARAEMPFMIGDVKITPIMCAHTEPHTDDAGRFRELSYFIEYGDEKLFFGGDFSMYDGVTARLAAEKPQYIIVPANGRDEARIAAHIIGNTHPWEAAKLAADCGATLIPSHWDLYAENGCSREDITSAAEKYNAKVEILTHGVPFEA